MISYWAYHSLLSILTPSAGNIILPFGGGWLVQTGTAAFGAIDDTVSISNTNLTAFFLSLA